MRHRVPVEHHRRCPLGRHPHPEVAATSNSSARAATLARLHVDLVAAD
ncbi:MAG: hypothetical protein ACFCVK_02310 [Acidimicrobiales bacterium]